MGESEVKTKLKKVRSEQAANANGDARYAGTGRRKTSIAKVWLVPGEGNIIVNHLPMADYFHHRVYLHNHVLRPLVLTANEKNYDVRVQATGGGIASQAFAVRMGIARALLEVNPELRGILKKAGLLTRDSRMKERKKYGHKRARKSFQYSKR